MTPKQVRRLKAGDKIYAMMDLTPSLDDEPTFKWIWWEVDGFGFEEDPYIEDKWKLKINIHNDQFNESFYEDDLSLWFLTKEEAIKAKIESKKRILEDNKNIRNQLKGWYRADMEKAITYYERIIKYLEQMLEEGKEL